MKHTISVVVLLIIFTLLSGLSCSPRSTNSLAVATVPALLNPQAWTPPIFPGAVSDQEIQVSMTAIASTPDALDENACICFGFPVHNAVFHAYRSDAEAQEIMDFYDEQMAAQGWKKIANDNSEATLPHKIWQHGANGHLVAYLMVAPMQDGRTLIYLSAAESDSPQEVVEQ